MRTLTVVLLVLVANAAAQAPLPSVAKRAADSPNFWRPIQPGEVTLFGALENLGQSLEQDRLLVSRGVHRSLNFQYRHFSYEKDFFQVYRGVTLKSFWDGRMDLGLFNHKPPRGVLFGSFGSGGRYYRSAASNRIELRLRWNLKEK